MGRLSILGRLCIICFPALTGLGCSVPTTYFPGKDPELEVYRCVKLRSEAELWRMVNTCPIFTDKPQPQTSFWHLSLNSRWIEKNKSDQEKWSSRLYSDKRSCTLPIYIPEYRFLQPGTKLTVQKIQESWDYENGYRLWLHGTVKTQKEETVDFEFEGFRKTEDIHFRQYIQQKFDSCE